MSRTTEEIHEQMNAEDEREETRTNVQVASDPLDKQSRMYDTTDMNSTKTLHNSKEATMRTDVHSPKNLITEDYEYVACGSFGSVGDPEYSPLAHEASYLLAEGWVMGENGSEGQCYHCGARLKFYAILKHIPTHTLIRVGETCLDNRFERSTAEFHKLRKQAQLDREQQRIKKTREAWIYAHPVEATFLLNGEHRDGFYGSLSRTLSKNGELSERQLVALETSMKRDTERDAERAAAQASEPVAARVIEGRIQITGKVLSTRWQENDFGGALKQLVLDDRGFKVWGTVPSALTAMIARGARVQFVATVTQSSDDPTFGFYSRPSKADFVSDNKGS